MKRHSVLFAAALGLWLTGTAPSHAATIAPAPGYAPGIGYEWGVTMSGNDTAVYQGSVGAKSWNEPANPPDAKGWTHTSDWTALNLTENTSLTVTLTRQSGVLFFPPEGGPPVTEGDLLTPAFSIYAGWETTGPESHQFNPVGNISWASELTYLDHEANPLSLTSITKTFSLTAGHYSLVFGGNPTDGTTGFHGYQATLSTVPIPAAVWLFGGGLAGLVGLARRRRQFIGA